MKSKNRVSEQGFTIVELMIALSVLSVILVMGTVIMINIGALYTKGINQARIQNATRTVVADVSSSIKYGGKPPLPSCGVGGGTGRWGCVVGGASGNVKTFSGVEVHALCVGTARYSFTLDRPLEVGSLPHVLWRDVRASDGQCTPLDLTKDNPGGTSSIELMPEHAQLTRFSINEPVSGTYNIEVYMALGPVDLIKKDSTTGHVNCSGMVGTQFCATSELNTSVTRLLE